MSRNHSPHLASLRSALLCLGLLASLSVSVFAEETAPERPNILLCLSDDQSYPHASAYGEPVIKTPVFDRVAAEGVLFTHAYAAAPSCTPSRSAILTGQDIWRLGKGGQLFGTLSAEHPVYTDLLREAGYHVGYMDKGWAPGDFKAGGRVSDPTGPRFKSFQEFINTAPEGKPWCFWFGSRDPHRGYRKGSGVKSGMDPAKVKLPDIFPDTPEVRSDVCDYFFEIQRFDRQIGEMLELIKQAGQLDDTLVVITSDNGMPFPRAKANLYDLGSRMPLAIRWPSRVPGGRKVDDFVNLTDLAPTFLEAAGVKPPGEITGRSLLALLETKKSGIVEPGRDAVFTGRERHAWCRIDGQGYPARMIRTRDFLYIRNYEPDRWPAGDFRVVTNEGHYGDIDASPTKDIMLARKDTDTHLFELAFGNRPREELYDCRNDFAQLSNRVSDPNYRETLRDLSTRLTAQLKSTGDPRETTGEAPWDAWKYHGRSNWKILPEQPADTAETSDHLIKQAKASFVTQDTQVAINAAPSDVVIIILGGSNNGPNGRSSQTGRSTLLGGSEMHDQGFKLIRMVGDDDSKIEAWAKLWTTGNSVLIPEHSKDAGYSITVFNGSKARVDPRYLDDGKIATENGLVKGLTRVKAKDGNCREDDMKLPLKVGGSGTTLVGIFFDDPCLNIKVIDGKKDVPIYGFKKGFGDGDSFGLLLMVGDQVNNLSVAKPPHEKQMRTDYSSITLNFEGWLIAAER